MQKKQSNFLGWLWRLCHTRRWSLMNSVVEENVAEHSHHVTVIAHMLAVVKNRKFDGNVCPETCATAGAYHDISESICTDFPNPLKYHNEEFTSLFKQLEHTAELSIHDSLMDDDLKEDLAPFIISKETPSEVKAIVKSADIISAYIKARYEYKFRQNYEFKEAFNNTRRFLQERRNEYQEVEWYYHAFVEKMAVSIDSVLNDD